MNKEQKPNSFSLRGLLILVAVFAVSMLPVAYWGVSYFPFSILLALSACLVWWGERNKTLWGLWGWVGLVLLLIFANLPHPQDIRISGKRTACQHKLRQLTLASLNYESAHGHFPPPYSIDENGKPLHSWRVLILPYLEEDNLHGKLDLTKPWNDPVNLQYANEMPDLFRCPAHEVDKRDHLPELMALTTSYVCVVGEETVWKPDASKVSYQDISDGSSNTILLLESELHRVHWMSPLDPRFEEVTELTMDGMTDLIVTSHTGVANVALADGSMHQVDPKLMNAESLRAFLAIDDEAIVNIIDF